VSGFDQGIERDELRRLYAYWQGKRAGRPMPAPTDIDPLELRFVVGNLTLVDVSHDPLRFRIRLHGTNLAERSGIDMTGKGEDDYPYPEFARFLVTRFTRAVEQQTPLRERADLVLDGRSRRYEDLVLPLSRDGVRVDRLLVGVFYDD